MAEIRFPSLEAPDKRAYVYDSMAYRECPLVDESLQFFETYGDGMVQHSGAYPIGVPLFCDWLHSLAAYLLANPEVASTSGISYKFESPVEKRQIAFAATVLYKAPKDDGKYHPPTYYSLSEHKIGSSEKYHYDKRFEEIPTWADGSPDAVARLLWNDYFTPLYTFVLNHAVRDWFNALSEDDAADYRRRGISTWMEIPTLTKDADVNQRRDWRDALNAIQTTIRGLKAIDSAQRMIAEYQRNLERQVTEAA